MVAKQLHQIIFQQPIGATRQLLVLSAGLFPRQRILGKSGLLRKIDKLAFALALQPRVRHGE
jgi:hypothetical protein